ncbi:MAG: guanylate kinase [Nitrospinae bacterium]|nr:guanylate kinase [Nitrospinota bacterium]
MTRREGIAFVLSAPSGTGKTTICKILKERRPDLKFSVSHTTRAPRKNETEGVDYFFIPEPEFKAKIERGEFLEWARVHGNYYGTAFDTVDEFKKKGQDLLLDLDVQGVQNLRKLNFPGVFVFILPPSLAELRQRLAKRGTEPEGEIAQRIEVGKNEISQYGLYDYVVTNTDIEEAVAAVLAIARAERSRACRFVSPSPDIQSLLDSKVKI